MKIETDLAKYDNSWYDHGSIVKRLLWYLISSVTINSYLPLPMAIKVFILKIFGAKIGKKVVIKPKLNIKYPWLLEIGNEVWISELVWIDNLVTITIEDNVCISQGAMLMTGNHNYKKSTFDLIVGKVYLEKGAWVGAKAIVCPGVRLKSHSVLAVNSVATHDLESYTVYQGNPAQLVRQRIISV